MGSLSRGSGGVCTLALPDSSPTTDQAFLPIIKDGFLLSDRSVRWGSFCKIENGFCLQNFLLMRMSSSVFVKTSISFILLFKYCIIESLCVIRSGYELSKGGVLDPMVNSFRTSIACCLESCSKMNSTDLESQYQ